jgi:hypothetical protein
MKSTHFIVVRRMGKVVAEHPVKRAVVRVGADPSSDVILEGDGLPASALTINFADPNKIICYVRAPVIESIAGQPVVLNQGVLLPLRSEISFANGYSLIAEMRDLSSSTRVETATSESVSNQNAAEGALRDDAAGLRRGMPTEKSVVVGKPGKFNVALPVISGVLVLSLLALIGIWIQPKNSASPIPQKSADGRAALYYQSIANQLFKLTDAELEAKPGLESVREQLQLAQKYRNNDQKAREHLLLARELLGRRLGNEIVSQGPLPPFLQAEFDRVSENQLYQEICKLLY